MSDIVQARYLIFAFGFLLALLAAFIWTYFLRFESIGLCLVWTGIVGIFVLMVCLVGVAQWVSLINKRRNSI